MMFKRLRQLLLSKNTILIIILTLLVIWAGKGIFKYNVFSTHDGNHHIARCYDAVQTIKEGHFPLRWAGSLNYGCGVPIYNFFYPLLYYLVIILEAISGRIIFSLKVIYFLSLLISTIFFYLWMKVETGRKSAAFASSLLYLFAPYRFSLIFVRGSPEFLAYALFPVVLYIYSLFFKAENRRTKLLLAFMAVLSGGALAISHNFTVLFLMPILLLYLIVKILNTRDPEWALAIFSFISSFTLSAFFILPAVVEKKFTKLGSLDIVNYKEHFPTLWQLIRSKWDYFYSSPGVENDGMSFMLGYAQWVVLAVSTTFLVVSFVKHRSRLKAFIFKNASVLASLTLSLLSVFMMLPVSEPLWEVLPFISDIQFPWRLLGIATFFISVLFGFLLTSIKNKKVYWLILVIVSILAIYGNKNHILPQPVSVEDLYMYSDFDKLHYHRYTTTTLGDDIIAPSAPSACYYSSEKVYWEDSSPLDHEVLSSGNTFADIKININEPPAERSVVLHLSYFPNTFDVNVNGIKIDYRDCQGLVCFNPDILREGTNFISWGVKQTPIQNIGNVITLITLVGWFVFVIVFYNKNSKFTRKDLAIFLTIFCTLIVFIFLRFTNIHQRISFGWDQERDAVAATEILRGNFTLIGPQALGPEGFFLPPYFYYFLSPFYFITSGNPLAMILFLAAYNLTFFSLSFIVIKRLFGLYPALFLLAFWAVNPRIVQMDTTSWNPLLIPLFVILLFYLYYSYYIKNKLQTLLLIGIMYGIGLGMHIQFLLLFPFVIPLVQAILKTSLKPRLKRAASLLFGFMLTLLPLVIFDIRNNFLNLNLMLGFLSKNSQSSGYPFLQTFDRFFYSLTGLYSIPGLGIISYILGLLFIIFIRYKITQKTFEKKFFEGLSYVWGLTPFYFLIYRGSVSEYYFNYLIPVFLVALAFAAGRIYQYLAIRKMSFFMVLVVPVLLFWLLRSYGDLKPHALSLFFKDKAISFLSTVSAKSPEFNVSFDAPHNEDAGFRYLLRYHKVPATGDPRDPLVEIIIPPDKKPEPYIFGGIGVYLPDGFASSVGLKEN